MYSSSFYQIRLYQMIKQSKQLKEREKSNQKKQEQEEKNIVIRIQYNIKETYKILYQFRTVEMLDINKTFSVDGTEFMIMKQIGQGGFCQVFQGVYQNKTAAIKVLKHQTMNCSIFLDLLFVIFKCCVLKIKDGDVNQHYHKEIEISRKIMNGQRQNIDGSSKYIVQIIEILEDKDQAFIIQEYCQIGNLYQYYSSTRNYFDELTLGVIMFQLASGVQFLHSMNISHRDLKPENIFISLENNQMLLKIGDFGISSNQIDAMSTLGTINYMAPEICRRQMYTNKVDIWSLGCIFYEIITKKCLFDDLSQLGVYKKIVNYQNNTLDSDQFMMKFPQFKDIILSCIKNNPEERPKIEEIENKLSKIVYDLSLEMQNQINNNNNNNNPTYQEYNSGKAKRNIYKNLIDSQDSVYYIDLEQTTKNLKTVSSLFNYSSTSNSELFCPTITMNAKNLNTITSQQNRQKQEDINFFFLNISKFPISQDDLNQNTPKYLIYSNKIKQYLNNFMNYQSQQQQPMNQNEKQLIEIITILCFLIKKSDMNLTKQFLNEMKLNDSNEDLKLKSILSYIIINTLILEDEQNKRLKYFFDVILRIKLFQTYLVKLAQIPNDYINKFIVQNNIDIQDYQKVGAYLPSSKSSQLIKYLYSQFLSKKINYKLPILITINLLGYYFYKNNYKHFIKQYYK